MALIVGSGITIGSGISIQPTDFDYERTGLLLHLDAGIPASYPGSGSTWTDLVASKTFTLYNSPTYTSDKGGYLNFVPASSQYAQSVSSLGVNLTSWTVEAWVSYVSTTGSNPAIVAEVQGGNNKVNYVLGVPDGVTAPRISAGLFATNWRSLTPGYLPTANNWYHAVGTFDGTSHTFNVYINGSLYATQTLTAPSGSYGSGAAGIRLMKRWDNENYWGGGLGVVRIYNSVLNSTQITRNWNYQRSRFNL
jgi:hypothetical protein